MHLKKFENPAKLFDPSKNPSVFVQTDTCHTCVHFGKCVNPSVIPLVIDVGTAVGMCADGHVSDVRALRDVRNPSVIPSVLYVGNSVGKPVGECGTIQ